VSDAVDDGGVDDGSGPLDAALSRGEMAELPPNQPKGLLGERGFNLRKTDSFEPDLNAGVSQENDLPVIWLGVLLAYLLFFPLAYWLLWRSPLFSRRAKIAVSVVGAAGIVVAGVALYAR
jgi:hypothetical protein